MRLDELTLEKYGAFPERRVDFAGPGLTVVYGPNEAGKSTSLQAVTDFLFGIPNNSSLGLFGNDAMRIGARLTCADGRMLELKRRKGRGKTLTDASGAGVDDGVLAALLGPTDRSRFTSLFGLNHESLRQGGEQLLAADGEIGRLIVEAGGGLRTLMERLDALDAEANRLFAPRRSGERAFYQALDAYTAADAAAKDASLSRETFEEARRAHDAARQGGVELRERRRRQATQISALERLVRVGPLLRNLQRLEVQLQAFADLPPVKADFDLRWPKAVARRDDALAALQSSEGEHAELEARLAGIREDVAILDLSAQVEALADTAVLVARARQDRANREREIAEGEAQLAALRDQLRLRSVDELADRLPPPDVLQTVRRLASEAVERRPVMRGAEDRVAELKDAISAAEASIEAAVAAGHGETWAAPMALFAGLPAQAAALDVRERQALATGEALQRDAAALGAADVDALLAAPAPDLDTVGAELVAAEAMETRRMRQEDLKAGALAQAAAADVELGRLRAGAAVATDAALAQARADREQAWRTVRRGYLAGEVATSAQQRADDVERLTHGLAAADDLADRRTTEAQRVAALLQAERRHAEADQAAAAAQAALDEIAATWQARALAFAAAFPQASALHPALPGLKAYVAARAELARRRHEQQQLEGELERQRADLRPAIELLSDVEQRSGLHPSAGATLSVRVQGVAAATATQDQARTALASAREALAGHRSRLAAEERGLATLRADEAAWQAAWRPALAQIGAQPDAPLHSANDLAADWASGRGVLAGLEATRRRLVRMDEDEADLRGRVAAILGELSEPLAGDAVAAAADLKMRLRQAQDLQTRRRSLQPELEALDQRLDARQAAFEQALQVVHALMAECVLDPGEEPAAAALADRVGAHRGLVTQVEAVMSAIHAAGDGEDVSALLEHLGVQEIDDIRGRLVAAEDEMRELDGLIEAAIRAEQAGRDQLAGFEQGNRVNQAMAQRESATARMHGVLERYVELKLARELVAAAVARVRGRQQDPLIQRAGELFKLTTRGQFSGVGADIDARGEPVVVGLRDGGGSVGVSGMSDGTRDQLFLAFRLASIENYCRAAEPLPFIADDILVHFDDARSAATLEVLADFAATTQVLLFTHHRSVLNAAEPLVATGRAAVARLLTAAAA